MALTVTDLLNSFEENNVSDDTYLFSYRTRKFYTDTDLDERACVALAEMNVDKKRLSLHFKLNNLIKGEGKQKILVMLIVSCDFNYYNCLTVGNFKKYVEKIEDKDEFVCILKPEWIRTDKEEIYYPILEACFDEKDKSK